MKFRATITYVMKLETGLVQTFVKHVNGSRTAIFNAISDIMINARYNNEVGELIDITVVIRKERV